MTKPEIAICIVLSVTIFLIVYWAFRVHMESKKKIREMKQRRDSYPKAYPEDVNWLLGLDEHEI